MGKFYKYDTNYDNFITYKLMILTRKHRLLFSVINKIRMRERIK